MCRRLKLLFLWVFATHLSIQYCLSFSAGCDVNYYWQEAMKKWTSPRCEWGHCDQTAVPCTSAWSGWCCASLCCQKLFRSQSAESQKEGPLLTLHCYLTVHLMAFRTWASTKDPHPSLFENWGMVHLDSRIFHNRYENNLAWFTAIDDCAHILCIFYIHGRIMKVLNCKWFQLQISYDIFGIIYIQLLIAE